MHGLGDNIHQRAVMRQLMDQWDVYLESSWVAPYHDLIPQGLKVLRRRTHLRTQTKNAEKERFWQGHLPPDLAQLKVSYRPEAVRQHGTVLAAMCEQCGVDYSRADFRLPVPPSWTRIINRMLGDLPKPLLVYRPLVERTEWGGCATRNPDHAAYAELFRTIRKHFFVVSVADLVPDVEWAVGEDIQADVEYHAGELPFPLLAGLVASAAMVYASPGFMVPLAQSLGVPTVCVFGGYESSRSFNTGHAPYLGIDTIRPCECFTHGHDCCKTIDMVRYRYELQSFAAACLRQATGSDLRSRA